MKKILSKVKYNILKTIGHKFVEWSVKKFMFKNCKKTISTLSTFKDGFSVVAHVTTEDPLSLFNIGNTHDDEYSRTTNTPRDKDHP